MLASYWRVMQEWRERRAAQEAPELLELEQAALEYLCAVWGHDEDCIHNRKGEPE